MVREFVNQSDKRVIKTKKSIIHAFTKLLTKYDGSEITITSVAKAAEVNRKTIYNYYNNVQEIFEEIENKCLTTFEEALDGIPYATNYRDIFLIFKAISKIVLDDVEFYTNIIHIRSNSKIIYKTYLLVINRIKKDLKEIGNIQEDKIDLVAKHVATSMISVYINWLRSDKKTDLNQYIDDVSKLVLNGIGTYRKYNF